MRRRRTVDGPGARRVIKQRILRTRRTTYVDGILRGQPERIDSKRRLIPCICVDVDASVHTDRVTHQEPAKFRNVPAVSHGQDVRCAESGTIQGLTDSESPAESRDRQWGSARDSLTPCGELLPGEDTF